MLWCNNFTLFKPSALLRVFSYSENMGKTKLIERIETASKYSDHPHDALWGGILRYPYIDSSLRKIKRY